MEEAKINYIEFLPTEERRHAAQHIKNMQSIFKRNC